jgi:hypothetical protein
VPVMDDGANGGASPISVWCDDFGGSWIDWPAPLETERQRSDEASLTLARKTPIFP